jgi:hypothetical protein
MPPIFRLAEGRGALRFANARRTREIVASADDRPCPYDFFFWGPKKGGRGAPKHFGTSRLPMSVTGKKFRRSLAKGGCSGEHDKNDPGVSRGLNA